MGEIFAAIGAEASGDWIVRIRWAEHTADFHYRGIFAEHLPRVAESTLPTVIHTPLPVLPQKRAATARAVGIFLSAKSDFFLPKFFAQISVNFRHLLQNIRMPRGCENKVIEAQIESR